MAMAREPANRTLEDTPTPTPGNKRSRYDIEAVDLTAFEDSPSSSHTLLAPPY